MKFLMNTYPYRDMGLLILRFGLGLMFMTHGGPKLSGGPAYWKVIGKSMHLLGVDWWPTFWGFMAGFAEFGGGLLLLLGLFSRPACLLLICTMIVATKQEFANGGGLNGASHAIEAGIVFLSLLFIGPGTYSLDNSLFNSGKAKAKSAPRRGKAVKK
jgi:putative oxidoreductase